MSDGGQMSFKLGRGYDRCSGADRTRAAKRRGALLGPLFLVQIGVDTTI